jgi:hypothetical protein
MRGWEYSDLASTELGRIFEKEARREIDGEKEIRKETRKRLTSNQDEDDTHIHAASYSGIRRQKRFQPRLDGPSRGSHETEIHSGGIANCPFDFLQTAPQVSNIAMQMSHTAEIYGNANAIPSGTGPGFSFNSKETSTITGKQSTFLKLF